MAIKEQRIVGRRVAMVFIYQALLLDLTIRDIEQNFMYDEGFLNLKGSTQDFIKHLCIASYQMKAELRERVQPYLKKDWNFERLSVIEQAILILSTYELIYGDVPKEVVMDEYVSLAKKFADVPNYKFINAVLDKVARESVS